MLTSFSVKNFRCFRDLSLEGLERINLIAGKNNVGKTSLLEAIHLHCLPDKPHLWVKVNRLRGIEDPLGATQEIAEWLFFKRQTDHSIKTASADTDGIERVTKFHFVDAATSRSDFPTVEASLAQAIPKAAGLDSNRLILHYVADGSDSFSISVPSEFGNGEYSLNARVVNKIPNLFLGSLIADEDRDIRNFGELERSKRKGEILPVLQQIEPRLTDLSLVPFAGKTRIHADLAGFSQLVPITQIGEGMRRLLSILLAIANVPGGIVFIDEFENGLHYSVQTQVWTAIAEAARTMDVQVFATTHSWECLEHAHEAFSRDAHYDLRLLRLDRVEDEVVPTSYDRDTMDAALELGVEVR